MAQIYLFILFCIILRQSVSNFIKVSPNTLQKEEIPDNISIKGVKIQFDQTLLCFLY